MAQEFVDLGTGPNSGDGDPARTAFGKVNNNASDAESRLASLENDQHVAVTLNADASTQESLNLSGQEIQAVPATNSSAGVATASQITDLEANTAARHDAMTLNAGSVTQDSANLSGQELTLVIASPSTAGVMSAADKTDLDANTSARHDSVTLNADTPTQDTLNLSGQEIQVNPATESAYGTMAPGDKAKLNALEQGDITVFSSYKEGTTVDPSTTATTAGTAPTLAEMTHTFTPDDATNNIEVFFSGTFENDAKKGDGVHCGIFIDGTLEAETQRDVFAGEDEDASSMSTFWVGTLSAAAHTIDVRFWGEDDTTIGKDTLRNFYIKETNEA